MRRSRHYPDRSISASALFTPDAAGTRLAATRGEQVDLLGSGGESLLRGLRSPTTFLGLGDGGAGDVFLNG